MAASRRGIFPFDGSHMESGSKHVAIHSTTEQRVTIQQSSQCSYTGNIFDLLSLGGKSSSNRTSNARSHSAVVERISLLYSESKQTGTIN